MQYVRPIWQNRLQFDSSFGWCCILLLGSVRFWMVLKANEVGSYQFIPFIFVCMMMLPFVLFTKEGRRQIGIRKPARPWWLLYSFLLGAAFCGITSVLAEVLFQQEVSNWFVYLSKSFGISRKGISEQDWRIFFLVYATVSMLFSPIGEELFYRGVVHESIAQSEGPARASLVDSLAFAFTHLAHFGIVFVSGAWHFLPIPALLWVGCMFLASKVFYFCKQKTGSLYGAILSHAGFNLTMVYYVFYHVL